MIKLLLLFTLTAQLSYSSVEELIFKDYTDLNTKLNTSHNHFYADVSLMTYKSENSLNAQNFTLVKDDSIVYWGPTIGLGRRFFLNSFLSIAANVEGYYYINNDTDERTYSEEFERTVYLSKNKNRMFGAKTFASLYLRKQVKNVYFEPFGLLGFGYSFVNNTLDYEYNDLVDKESYDASVKENFRHVFYGLGLNILSRSGLSVYLKASKNLLTIGSSKISGTSEPFNAVDSTSSSKIDRDLSIDENRDELTFTLGFTYIF